MNKRMRWLDQHFTLLRVCALAALLCVAWSPNPVSADTAEILDPHPLEPADTSSPRDTLRSFLNHFSTLVEAWQSQNSAARRRATARAAAAFDFSELPDYTRGIDEFEKMTLLKEILDRVELPDEAQIPGDEQFADPARNVTRWTVPRTEIEIVKVDDGPRKGEFLFSKRTVDRLDDYYRLAKGLPYKPGADVNLYRELLTSPGPLIPRSWVETLPAWAHTIIFGNGLWQWMVLAAVLLAAIFLIRLIYKWGKAWDLAHTDRSPWRCFGVPIAFAGIIIVAILAQEFVVNGIWLFGLAYQIVAYLIWTVIFGAAACLTYTVAGRFGDALAQKRETESERLRSALLRILFRLFSIIALVFITIGAAEFFGVPIAPLVAGVGVGGLAIALAVQPTMENVIGGLTLLADQPIRIGDSCRYGDKKGIVEGIGLRSTRIRSPEREIVTIPNRDFMRMQIANLSLRDRRLYETVLNLRCETKPDQLRYVLIKLREMLMAHPRVIAPARVRFIGFGESSFDLELYTHVNAVTNDDYLAVREDLNLRIIDIVADAGTDFANPSTTAYLRRDPGVDDKRGQEVQSEVDILRAKGRLPFPEFEHEVKERLEDTLDYPPKGSPDYKQPIK